VTAYAAAAWAFLFAAASFYWAVGGSVGEHTIAANVDEAGVADPLLLWTTGALKVVAGLLALALVQSWGRRFPDRLLGAAAWLVAGGLVLYGALSFVDHVLMEVGARATPRALGSTAVRWHLALWDPFWILGGLLFFAAARAFRRDRSRLRPATRG
jgi:hypothetical protein